jgi:hypothetical protein
LIVRFWNCVGWPHQLSKKAATKFERKKRLQRAYSGSPELLTHHLLHITTMKWPSWKRNEIFRKVQETVLKKNSEQRNLRHKKKKLIWCGLSLNLDSLIPFLSITLDLFLNEDQFEELICFFKRFCYKYANYCKIIQ